MIDIEHAFKRRDWDSKKLAHVQKLCMAFPEVVEAEQFGGSWWKAGKKAFCAYGAMSLKRADGYHGIDGVCVKLPRPLQRPMLQDKRFEPEMMMGHHGWTSMTFDGRKEEWDEVASLLGTAYRAVAIKRMLEKLAIERIVEAYEEHILDPGLRPEFVEDVRRVRKGPFRKVKNIGDLLK